MIWGYKYHLPQTPRNSDWPVAWVSSIWACALSRTWAQTLKPVSQHPEEAPLPGILTHPGSQDPRITGAWSHQDLRFPEAAWLPGALARSGSQGHRIPGSQKQLNSEEFWNNQDHRKDRLQSDRVRASSTRDNHMAGGKHSNRSNRNQGYRHDQNQILPP